MESERRRGHDPRRIDKSKKHIPTMPTTDLRRASTRHEKISRRFYEHPDQFADAFARAWFKLTHCDMGRSCAIGKLVPKETLIWQDDHSGSSADRGGICGSKAKSSRRPVRFPAGLDRLGIGVPFRGSDKRGGANGARIRLAPWKDWDGRPPELARSSRSSKDPEGVRQEGVARRPDRSRWQRRDRKAAKDVWP